jgi:hypothetical protein
MPFNLLGRMPFNLLGRMPFNLLGRMPYAPTQFPRIQIAQISSQPPTPEDMT